MYLIIGVYNIKTEPNLVGPVDAVIVLLESIALYTYAFIMPAYLTQALHTNTYHNSNTILLHFSLSLTISTYSNAWLVFGEPTMMSQILKSIFACMWMLHLQRHQALTIDDSAFTNGIFLMLSNNKIVFLGLCYPNRTAWGAKLLLTAALPYPVDCVTY